MNKWKCGKCRPARILKSSRARLHFKYRSLLDMKYSCSWGLGNAFCISLTILSSNVFRRQIWGNILERHAIKNSLSGLVFLGETGLLFQFMGIPEPFCLAVPFNSVPFVPGARFLLLRVDVAVKRHSMVASHARRRQYHCHYYPPRYWMVTMTMTILLLEDYGGKKWFR